MKRLSMSLAVVVFVFLSLPAQESKAWGWHWGWGNRYYGNYGSSCNRCYYPNYNYGSNGYGSCGNYGSCANYAGACYGNYGSYANYGALYGGYGYGNYGAGFPTANLLSILGAGGSGLAGAQASYISIPVGGGFGQPIYLQVPVGGAAGRPSYMQVPVSTGFGQPIYMQIQLGPTAINNSPAPSPAAAPPVGYFPGQGDSITAESKLEKVPILNILPAQSTDLRDRNLDGTGSPAPAPESGRVTTLDGDRAKAPTGLARYSVTKNVQEIPKENTADGAWSPPGLPTYSELHAQALSRRKASPPFEPGRSLEVASSTVDR